MCDNIFLAKTRRYYSVMRLRPLATPKDEVGVKGLASLRHQWQLEGFDEGNMALLNCSTYISSRLYFIDGNHSFSGPNNRLETGQAVGPIILQCHRYKFL